MGNPVWFAISCVVLLVGLILIFVQAIPRQVSKDPSVKSKARDFWIAGSIITLAGIIGIWFFHFRKTRGSSFIPYGNAPLMK